MGSAITAKGLNYKKLIDSMPSQAVPNYAYHNNGNLTFSNKADEWGLGQPQLFERLGLWRLK